MRDFLSELFKLAFSCLQKGRQKHSTNSIKYCGFNICLDFGKLCLMLMTEDKETRVLYLSAKLHKQRNCNLKA